MDVIHIVAEAYLVPLREGLKVLQSGEIVRVGKSYLALLALAGFLQSLISAARRGFKSESVRG